MISFPNAKINLGLHIVAKRPDGFHNIETVFYPIALADALEFVETEQGKATSLVLSGIPVDGVIEDNIVLKAYQLLAADYDLPPLSIYLQKNIPLGAGLGGGSADAASMLLMLNQEYDLHLSQTKLEQYAARIGADCPFFIQNRPVYATQKGEIMSPVSLDLSQYYLVVVKPPVHVNTAMAYAACTPKFSNHSLTELIKQPVATWKNVLRNDFEVPIFAQYPIIKQIKNQLYDLGAVYAAMSGSGAAVFGLFSTQIALDKHFASYYSWQGKVERI